MHRRFSWRVFAAFGVTLSFAAMMLTGAVLFVAPRSWTARLIDGQVPGLERVDWRSAHIAFAAVFVLIAAAVAPWPPVARPTDRHDVFKRTFREDSR